MKEYIERFQKSPAVTSALLAVVFLLVNWVSYSFYIRFDLSEAGLLRLTSASKKIIRNLPDTVTLEAFFSDEVPDAQLQKVKNLRDFLREYETASRGKVKLFFLDPDSDSDAKSRAQAQGIQPVQAGQVDETGIGIKNIYLSLLISYGDQKEVIPNVLDSGVMEYQLTSRIYKMANPNSNKIGFLANHGPFTLQAEGDPFTTMRNFAEQVKIIYGDIVAVDTAASDVPGEVSTLIIAGPNELSDMDKFRIDQFILRGGNVILAVSGMPISMRGQFMGSPIGDDIIEYFKHYGAAFGKDMLMEPRNFVSWKQPVGFQLAEAAYPFWVVAIEDNLQPDHVLTKPMPLLFFPWASSVKPDTTNLKDKDGKETAKITILAKTSVEAWAQSNFVMLAPQAVQNMMKSGAKQNTGQFNLALHIEGNFNSYFKGKKRPKGAPKKYLKKSEKPGQILALSSPYMLADMHPYFRFDQQLGQAWQVNYAFLLSAVDIMNGFGELAEARQNRVVEPKHANLESWQKRTWTLANFLLPILGLSIFGILRFIRRKRQSETEYQSS